MPSNNLKRCKKAEKGGASSDETLHLYRKKKKRKVSELKHLSS